MLALYAHAYRLVVRELKRQPALLLTKFTTVIGRTIALGSASLAFVCSIWLLADNPHAHAATLFGYHSAINTTSLVQVLAFKPNGPVPFGPFGFLVTGLARIARLCRAEVRGARAGHVEAAVVRPTRRAASSRPEGDAAAGSLSLGISLRFARECIRTLGLNETHPVAGARRELVDHFERYAGSAGLRPVVELYEQARTFDGEPAVGEATVLVLHAPDIPFVQLAEALTDYARHQQDEARTFFWLSAFAGQNEPLFDAVSMVRFVGRVAIALEKWDSPLPMELLAQAVQLNARALDRVDVAIALPEQERARLARAVAEAPEATRDTMLAATLAGLEESIRAAPSLLALSRAHVAHARETPGSEDVPP